MKDLLFIVRELTGLYLDQFSVFMKSAGTDLCCTSHLPCATGQKLFRRAGASTDLTETSCTQAEATFQEENPTGIGSSINPPISPPTPETPHHTSGDLVPEKNLKSSSEIDDLEASEEMHPEGQEAEGSTR